MNSVRPAIERLRLVPDTVALRSVEASEFSTLFTKAVFWVTGKALSKIF